MHRGAKRAPSQHGRRPRGAAGSRATTAPTSNLKHLRSSCCLCGLIRSGVISGAGGGAGGRSTRWMFAPLRCQGGSMFAKALETLGAVAVKPAEYFSYQDSASLHAMRSSSQPRRLKHRLTSPALPTERCLHLDSCQPNTSLHKADSPPSLPIPERSKGSTHTDEPPHCSSFVYIFNYQLSKSKKLFPSSLGLSRAAHLPRVDEGVATPIGESRHCCKEARSADPIPVPSVRPACAL